MDEEAAGDVADDSLSVGKRSRRVPLCKPTLSKPAYEQDKVKLEGCMLGDVTVMLADGKRADGKGAGKLETQM